MPDAIDFASALTSLKAALDIAKSLIGAREQAVIRTAVIELQTQIVSAQEATISAQLTQSATIQRVRDLEKEVTDLKEWDAEKENYQLTNVRQQNAPGGYAYAYALKIQSAIPETQHLLCANCFDQGEKAILQEEERYPGGISVLFCLRCESEISRTGIWNSSTPSRSSKPKPTRKPR